MGNEFANIFKEQLGDAYVEPVKSEPVTLGSLDKRLAYLEALVLVLKEESENYKRKYARLLFKKGLHHAGTNRLFEGVLPRFKAALYVGRSVHFLRSITYYPSETPSVTKYLLGQKCGDREVVYAITDLNDLYDGVITKKLFGDESKA